MTYQYLCLPIQSDQPTGCCPDAYLIAIDRITLRLKGLLESAARLRESQTGFRQIEIDFDAGTWVKLNDATADYDFFQEADPVKAGWASEYNQDDMASSPVDGFSAQADGFGNLEFRCYAADTGIYFWSDPVRVDRLDDHFLVTFGNQVYSTLTGELSNNQNLEKAAMSTRVYSLKHATPKMKYHHMAYVLDWRAELKQNQADFAPETCPLCGGDLSSRPLWMVGKFEICFSCYEALEKQGNRPVAIPKPAPGDHATDLACRALVLMAHGKATHETFRGLDLAEVTELVKKLEAQHFWLGKYADGSFIHYLSEKPLTVRHGRKFVDAVGPFLSPLGAAYYARRKTASLKIPSAAEVERLAREDNEGAWPLIREQLLVEMSMSPQEMNNFLGDMAAEYDPS